MKTDLQATATTTDYDGGFDVVASHPGDVETVVEVFADAEAYVSVSRGAAYGDGVIPKREGGETGLKRCTPGQATDDFPETYGARKAAGDRAVSEVVAERVRTTSARPCVVYGPHDYVERRTIGSLASAATTACSFRATGLTSGTGSTRPTSPRRSAGRRG